MNFGKRFSSGGYGKALPFCAQPTTDVSAARHFREWAQEHPELAACKVGKRVASQYPKPVTLPKLKCLEPKESA